VIVGVCRPGVAGVDERGEDIALGDFLFETLLFVACAWSVLRDGGRGAPVLVSISKTNYMLLSKTSTIHRVRGCCGNYSQGKQRAAR
jgi:hypothetical protein